MMYIITNGVLTDRWDVQEVPNTNDFEVLQGYVGGLIQYAPVPEGCKVEFIVNEEGLLLGMPYNKLASDLLKSFWLQAHDEKDLTLSMLELVGPCVIKTHEANSK